MAQGVHGPGQQTEKRDKKAESPAEEVQGKEGEKKSAKNR
jgi:hypothetical protein